MDRMPDHDNNKIIEETIQNDPHKYKYNFVNTPWDDRTKRSKVGITSLLLAILLVIIACVVNCFWIHYRYYNWQSNLRNNEMTCLRARNDDYPFVARIHPLSSSDIKCVGAVISDHYVLTHKGCTDSNSIKISLGNHREPRCRKYFSVNNVEKVDREDNANKSNLVMLFSNDNIDECSDVIPIGKNALLQSPAYIIGRPMAGRALTLHPVNLLSVNECQSIIGVSTNQSICVKSLVSCPIAAGDLLVQRGNLYGVSPSTEYFGSTNKTKLMSFVEIEPFRHELMRLRLKKQK